MKLPSFALGLLYVLINRNPVVEALIVVPRSMPIALSQRSSPCSTKTTSLSLLPDSAAADLLTSTSQLFLAAAESYPVSPEPIHGAFQVGTFFAQPFFLLMILFPKASFTKKIMGGLEIPLAYALIHFFIVASSIATEGSGVTAPLSEFNNVFDPAGDSQLAFMKMVTNYPNFVAEEWIHVLCWDLFVGRYIWLDGLKRGIFTAPAVLFCNLIGPPGLIIHFITCLIAGKPIFDPTEKEEIENL